MVHAADGVINPAPCQLCAGLRPTITTLSTTLQAHGYNTTSRLGSKQTSSEPERLVTGLTAADMEQI